MKNNISKKITEAVLQHFPSLSRNNTEAVLETAIVKGLNGEEIYIVTDEYSFLGKFETSEGGTLEVRSPQLQKFTSEYVDKKEDAQFVNTRTEELENIGREILGKVVFDETTSELSGSFMEIGCDLLDVIYDCKTREQYDLVNRTVAAITGSSLERIAEMAKELENERMERE